MQYARPTTMEEAIQLVAEAKSPAFIMAGGSDLLVRMKGGYVEPDLIVDIKAIGGLDEIKQTGDGFVIGAAVPCAMMGETAALREGLARRRRGSQPDRFKTDSGTLHDRRQSVQRLARCR